MRLAALAVLAGLAALGPGRARALDVERAEVRQFIDEVAERDHFERAWVARIVAAAETQQSVIDAMARPAERVKPWYAYRAIFVTGKRIREGREFYAAHRALLDEVAARTGVPAEIITAILGIETFYGRDTGRYRVLDALATLAFDYPPRASYFRAELEQFLLLSREAGFDPLKATGSYAGAMGAPQFMPRSYRSFARDGDRDGHIDLWNNWADVAESVAHYFVANGWQRGGPLYVPAELWYPDVEGLPGNRLALTDTVATLRAQSVSFDSPLPDDAPALFIALREADAPSYRVGFQNFWVITRYNRSAMYALAAAELAAAIVAEPAAAAAADAAAAPAAVAAPAATPPPAAPPPPPPDAPRGTPR
jgi:membrane-bound lytic murein transglycosylase B